MKLASLLLLSCACSAPDVTPIADAGSDAHASAKDVSAPEVAPNTNPHVSGVVTDPQGAPWPDAKIQVCSASLCTLGNADAAGAFSVLVPAGNRYLVIAHAAPGDPRDTSAGLAVLSDVLTTDVTLPSPIAIPILGARQALPSAAVTQDLTLGANAADVSVSGDAYFSGVSVTASPYPGLAAWALGPWGTRTNPTKTIAVTIANHFGLAPGDTVSVCAVNESTAELGPPSQATVSSDGTTISGANIDRVTWVVLAH